MAIWLLSGAAAAQTSLPSAPQSSGVSTTQAAAATPDWARAGALTPAGEALLAALAEAERHGLPASRYDAQGLRRALESGAPGAEAKATETYLRYARDVSSGIVEPRELSADIQVDPPRRAPEILLRGLASSPDPAAYLAGLAPAAPEYGRLQDRLAVYRAYARAGDWGPRVAEGPTLRLGDRGPRVAALRDRLTALGDLGVQGIRGGDFGPLMATNDVVTDVQLISFEDGSGYDAALEEAVRRFQARHGLNEDGLVGPATLRLINQTPAERLTQIVVNLERLRWTNRDRAADRIEVNIPDYRMALYRDGREIFESRVVVGKRKHQTVEFDDEMEHLVVNPTWYVPYSIASKEILPKLQADPGYLAANNMRLHGADPWGVDWSSVTQRTFPGRVTQGPGRGNALGKVKFMFPNDNAIYLHDTPAKRLFSRDVRAFSHGCVRVEKPYELAGHLLDAQMENGRAAFDRWARAGRERYVNLDRHLPVHIGYRTAWVDDAGRDQFRNDIYGRDDLVIDALERAGVTAHRL